MSRSIPGPRILPFLALLGAAGFLLVTWQEGSEVEQSWQLLPAQEGMPPATRSEAPQESANEEIAPDNSARLPLERESDHLVLHGILQDRETGEKVCDYELVMLQSSGLELPNAHVRSGEQGEVRLAEFSSTNLPPAPLRVRLIDHPPIFRSNSASGEMTLDLSNLLKDPPEPLLLEVSVGPTVAFDVILPLGYAAADFSVELTESRPQFGRWKGAVLQAELRAPLGYGMQAEHPWVRFGELPAFRDRAWLAVRSKDKRWEGGAWLTKLRGKSAQPLRIALAPTTSLCGRFQWPSDVEENYVQSLRLAQMDDGELLTAAERSGAGKDGAFQFHSLPLGRYRLWTLDAHWQPFQLEFEVQPGINDLGTLELFPRHPVGDIRGRIRSRSGRFEGACHVSLSQGSLDDDATYDHSLDFYPAETLADVGGGNNPSAPEIIADFEFENVTAGDWSLYVHCHDGYSFLQQALVVRAPAENIEIVLDDATMNVVVTLRAAESGELCEDAEFEWTCAPAHDAWTGAQVVLPRLPAAPERLRWVASAPGRRPRIGDGLEFASTYNPAGELELRGELELELGFARLIEAFQRGTALPIAGVELTCDGDVVGRTGSDGRLYFERAAAPQKISLHKDGYHHVWSSTLDPSTGEYTQDGVLYALFEPE